MRNIQTINVMAFMCVLCLGVGFINSAHAQVLDTKDTVVIVDDNGNVVGPAPAGVGATAGTTFYMDPFVFSVGVRKNWIQGGFRGQYEFFDHTGKPLP